jgi:hypothetical protein
MRWPDGGLLLIQEDSIPANRPMLSAKSAVGTGLTKSDAPLEVHYPAAAVDVAPGQQLSLDIHAEIQDGYQERYEITQLQFIGLSHPRISQSQTNYGAFWEPAALAPGSDTQGVGTLTWRPSDVHVDADDRLYTAEFKAIAKERQPYCPGIGRITWCDTKTVDLKVKILVAWNNLPEPTTETLVQNNASLTLEATADIRFTPNLATDFLIERRRLKYANIALRGPIAFETRVSLMALASSRITARQEIFTKRFARLLMIGQVPVVVSGRLKLDIEAKTAIQGTMDLTQELDIGYDILAGLRYENSTWAVIKDASPWQRYELRGDAEARAEIELRFIPDLEVTFYDVVTGQIILEPYLFAEMAVEGHFVYRGIPDSMDADYRFTKLEFGGGFDGRFRAGVEVFDRSIFSYPSTGFENITLIEKTPFIGLPTMTTQASGEDSQRDDCAIGVTAEVEDLPNPFQGLFGGPDSFNPFVEASGAWQVVEPNGSETLEPGDEPMQAWFSAEQEGSYTLRFSGHSELGSFVRQYEEIEVSYDPDDTCEGGKAFALSQALDDGLASLGQAELIELNHLGQTFKVGSTRIGSGGSSPELRNLAVTEKGDIFTVFEYFPAQALSFGLDNSLPALSSGQRGGVIVELNPKTGEFLNNTIRAFGPTSGGSVPTTVADFGMSHLESINALAPIEGDKFLAVGEFGSQYDDNNQTLEGGLDFAFKIDTKGNTEFLRNWSSDGDGQGTRTVAADTSPINGSVYAWRDWVYSHGGGELLNVNTTTGVPTVIADFSTSGIEIASIAFAADGTLFGSGWDELGQGAIFLIDPNNKIISFIEFIQGNFFPREFDLLGDLQFSGR